jgi:iron complex outermembrane receptor protein
VNSSLKMACARIAVISALIGPSAIAQTTNRQPYNIDAQDLVSALRTVANINTLQLIADPARLAERQSTRIVGQYTLQEVVEALLRGTGLRAEFSGTALVIRGSKPSLGTRKALPLTEDRDITVTGSRIRGAPSSRPVVILKRNEMVDRGLNDLGEVIRSIPQNFNGGQNPGITFSASGSQNVTSGSGLNLRGIGSDATLTLLNGHRVAYDGPSQAIDISAIPILAVDRLEIVPDGSSALYGSDAVGGVANVILKRDFDGIETRARIGGTSDGGGFQQQYSVVAGKQWDGGGFLSAIDWSRGEAITATDRDITATLPTDTTLYPKIKALNLLATRHQDIGSVAEFSIDAFYNHRTSETISAYTLPNVLAYGTTFETDQKSYSIAPRFTFELDNAWQLAIEGVRAESSISTDTNYFYEGDSIGLYPTSYSTDLNSVEIRAEGPVWFSLGGAVRAAAGIGYRSVGLSGKQLTIIGSTTSVNADYDGRRDTAYGYGELFIPFFSEANSRTGIQRLDLTIATRIEHDNESGAVLTPKVGLSYSPVSGLVLQGSWGRSFKQPTLYQLLSPASATIARATSFSSVYPSTATVLLRNGGNPSLSPERATTWSASARFRPLGFPGAEVSVSYYRIRYKGRVTSPLGAQSGALTNPLYANLVTLSPTTDEINTTVASLTGTLYNNSGRPFDPTSFVAIFDNRFHNLARFNAEGIDIAGTLPFDLGAIGLLTANGAVSYLTSSQKALADAPAVDQAGFVGSPSHWRGSGTLRWESGSIVVTGTGNVTGGVTHRASGSHIGGMTTFDLTVRHRSLPVLDKGGFEAGLSVLNIANRMPRRIPVSAFYYPPFDSTNYSIQGRYIGLSVGKSW